MSAEQHRASRMAAVALLVVPLLLLSALPAAGQSAEERRLRETQAKLEQVREQVAAAQAERRSREQELAEAEQQLAAVLEAVNAAELAVQRQQEAVEQARAKLGDLEAQARAHERVMAGRAVTLYRQGSSNPWAALLGAEDVDEALERSTYVEVVSRADRGLFERVEISQVQVDAQRETLEAEEATLRRVLEQQEAIYAQVEELRDERAMVLAGAEERLDALQSTERHLESESRQIAAMARRASQARQAAAARSRQPAQASTAASTRSAGGWTWPAGGRVTSEFGRRWGRMHEGLDIGAGTGAPVVAARAGRVTFAGRMGGYGNMVLVDHGGGIVTAYAHLSAFAVTSGQQVGGGQRVGSVGCTGSCTGPHLHFEVRVNGGARNPRGFLP